MPKIIFTPENLINKIHCMGGWSQWHLSSIAFDYFFPSRRIKDEPSTDARLATRMGCESWCEVITFYHITVGYTKEQLTPDVVNRY